MLNPAFVLAQQTRTCLRKNFAGIQTSCHWKPAAFASLQQYVRRQQFSRDSRPSHAQNCERPVGLLPPVIVVCHSLRLVLIVQRTQFDAEHYDFSVSRWWDSSDAVDRADAVSGRRRHWDGVNLLRTACNMSVRQLDGSTRSRCRSAFIGGATVARWSISGGSKTATFWWQVNQTESIHFSTGNAIANVRSRTFLCMSFRST